MHIPVLDHGYVRLIDSMGKDQTIVEAARMSTGKGFLGWDPRDCDCTGAALDGAPTPDCPLCAGKGTLRGDQHLLTYLYSHHHMTPFEMCELHLEVQAPIMVFREWHRHRTQSYNEFSARYAVMPNLHYVPSLDRFRKPGKNKQGSDGPPLSDVSATDFRSVICDDQQTVYANYEAMLEEGLAPEVARINCPVSRYSRMRGKTDLRNWLAFLTLRAAPDAQWEIRQYAHAVAEIVKTLWPRAYELFEEYTLYAVTLSRTEVAAMQQFFRTNEASPALAGALKKLGLSPKEPA